MKRTNRWALTLLTLGLAALAAAIACGGDTPAGGPGTIGQPCLANGSCSSASLTCVSNVCVDLDAGLDATLDSTTDQQAASDSNQDAPQDASSDAPGVDASDASDGGILGQSCLPGDAGSAGLTNCGPDGGESCCTSLPVEGGTYYRTYTSDDAGMAQDAADPATVSGFRLDKYEVTVGRFRQFVTAWNADAGAMPTAGAGKHTHLNGGSGLAATGGGFEPGWSTWDNGNISPTDPNLACDAPFNTWTPSAGGNEKRPINCVNWYEAAAFCIWDGGFLPSEAEWEYAAAGGSDEREYPWGATAPGTNNVYAIYGCYYPSSSGSCTDVSNIAPVGTPTAGAGRYGQLDLAGNVREWNLDWFAGYKSCTNCTDATLASFRVRRGGFFIDVTSTSELLPTRRESDDPTSRSFYLGFRCARTP